MISRRDIILGMSAGLGAGLLPSPVLASSARAVTVTELIHHSKYVLVGVTEHAQSQWETHGGSRRIVTYSRVRVAQPLDGRPPEESELYVRTFGGRVGDIGQIVHGEARLELGRPGVLFLVHNPDGAFSVTAMAQGHYLLRPDRAGIDRLRKSPDLPHLVDEAEAAVRRLPGSTIPETERIIESAMPPRR